MNSPISGSIQRFICDEMLTRLARWLRAAGYDTRTAEPGGDDRALMERAVAEDLLILTRDRKFLERRGADTHVFLLRAGKIPGQAQEITKDLDIDWLKQPFSRCLVDNALVLPDAEVDLARLPWSGRGISGPFTVCPECGRRYWVGGHTRKMLGELENWSRGRFE